jgi:hypothetical protein
MKPHGGTPLIQRKIPYNGGHIIINRRSGARTKAQFAKIRAVLDMVEGDGNFALLQSVADGTISPLELLDAMRRKTDRSLVTKETG